MLALGLLRGILGSCSNAAEAAGEVDPGTCAAWASAGECEANANYMHAKCSFACGCPSSTNSSAACEDRDKTGACASWAASGECEANPSYMRLKCAASCGTCELLYYKVRCAIDPELQPAVPPGAMAETFSLSLSNFAEYEPQLLSTDPPVLTLENFVQPDEVDEDECCDEERGCGGCCPPPPAPPPARQEGCEEEGCEEEGCSGCRLPPEEPVVPPRLMKYFEQ